jgi:hypothetical protein
LFCHTFSLNTEEQTSAYVQLWLPFIVMPCCFTFPKRSVALQVTVYNFNWTWVVQDLTAQSVKKWLWSGLSRFDSQQGWDFVFSVMSYIEDWHLGLL